MENRPRPEVHPFCTELESKKTIMTSGLPRTVEDVLDASNHCWCGVTAQVVGPDGELAHPEDCQDGRSCFRSPFRAKL